MFRFLPGLLLIAAGSGCAFTSVSITPPPPSTSSAARGGNGREIVIQTPFADARPNAARCGMKKNGYNMDTADVKCSADPNAYLAELLANELKRAGFTVAYRQTTSADPLQIEGKLLQFFIEPMPGWIGVLEADIHVRLSATSASGLVAERDFYVKSQEKAYWGLEFEFQKATDESTQQIVSKMAAAIVSIADRFPELGEVGPRTTQVPNASRNGDKS